MRRVGILILLAALGACTVSPSITRTRTTLGEVNMEGLECRPDKAPGSSIGRTICASPEDWARYEKDQIARSQAIMAQSADQQDNRQLYPGMKKD